MGQIPGIGHLFRNNSRTHRANELVFFITPKIYSEFATHPHDSLNYEFKEPSSQNLQLISSRTANSNKKNLESSEKGIACENNLLRKYLVVLLFGLGLLGCTTLPFKPKSDIRIVSVSSGSGGDEINPSQTLITAGAFPYQPAVIQFTLNNGVGVTITDLQIDYTPSEGNEIVYQDANGVVQTGIPPKRSKIQRRFEADIPFTELGLSSATQLLDGINVGTGTSRRCCLFINLVTQNAAQVLSVDGNFQTLPNLNTDIIANLTITGVDHNDNPFVRDAAILVSAIAEQNSATFDPGCDATCSIGNQPVEGGAAGGATAGADAGAAALMLLLPMLSQVLLEVKSSDSEPNCSHFFIYRVFLRFKIM